MKYIQTFESFYNEELYEFMGGVRKFITGHESKENLEKAKQRINDEIENVIKKYNSNPNAFRDEYNIEDLRKNLIESAKKNNYRGSVKIRYDGVLVKYYIVYDPKSSGLQELGKSVFGSEDEY